MSASISRRKFIATTAAGVGLAATTTAGIPGGETSLDEGILPVRPLGATGLMPTVLGFGAGSRYLQIQDPELAERMIVRAIELGVRYFDTAYTYGANRESMKRFGRYLTPRYRDQILLATKLEVRDAESAKRQFEECLTDLNTDRVDILHFHAVGTKEEVDRIASNDGALKVYRNLKESGAIRAIGVTGHADSKVLLYALERLQPDCIMCPQNPGHGQAQQGGIRFTDDIIPYALQHGIGLLAMKTTGQDGLMGRGGVTGPELVRYAMSLPVASAIVGMSSLEVLESCASIARSLVPMTEEEMAAFRQRVSEGTDMGQVLPYLTPGYVDGVSYA